MAVNFFPVFLFDPNCRGHRDDKSGENWVYNGVHDKEMRDDILEGYVKLNDTCILFQQSEGPTQQNLDDPSGYGWGHIAILRDVVLFPDGGMLAYFLAPKEVTPLT